MERQLQRADNEQYSTATKQTSNSRRRFLKTTAASVGVMAGLAGCAGSQGGDTPETTTSEGTTGETKSGSGSSDPKLADKINIYTFGGVNGEAINKAYIQPFSEEFGVEVNHQTIASGWDLIPKIKNDSVDAHIVEQNPGSVLGGIPGVWQQIRLDNIPTVMKNLQIERLRGDAPETSFDPGEAWHYVPKEVWAQGLVYNHDQVEKPSSWHDIYTDELKGKLTNTGFTALALGVAGSEAGVNFNQIMEDDAVASAMWDRVDTQNEYVYQWWNSGSTAQQLLTRESALAGNFWYGRVAALRDQQDVPVSYTVPEEGTVGGVSCWTVGVEDDPGRYTAEKFIDFQARPEPSRVYSTLVPYYQPYPVPNPPTAYAENPDRKHIERIKLWDYKVVQENREDWSQKFQQTIQS